MLIDVLVGVGPTLSWFRDWTLCWDSLPFFMRLRIVAPLLGGSDVVHCVRVSLTGTTVATF